jgi:hypothetical protein
MYRRVEKGGGTGMEGWMDGGREGRTDGGTDGRTEGGREGGTDGRTEGEKEVGQTLQQAVAVTQDRGGEHGAFKIV